jgi:hypothetical protein
LGRYGAGKGWDALPLEHIRELPNVVKVDVVGWHFQQLNLRLGE